jgi:DNA-binding beta-propeller fold protein YncE
VIDEASRRIVDRIPSEIGIPTGVTRSYDRKKIYVTSNDNDGIEVIDIASHKVLEHFVLNAGNSKMRINGVAPDPDDKLLYSTVREVVKQTDRYEVGKLKYAVIDLAQQKIVRTADMAQEDQETNESWYGRSPFHVSPDGKYLTSFATRL